MQKLLLGLGSIMAVAIPVVAVVSCGEDDGSELTNIIAKKNTEKIKESLDKITDALNKINTKLEGDKHVG